MLEGRSAPRAEEASAAGVRIVMRRSPALRFERFLCVGPDRVRMRSVVASAASRCPLPARNLQLAGDQFRPLRTLRDVSGARVSSTSVWASSQVVSPVFGEPGLTPATTTARGSSTSTPSGSCLSTNRIDSLYSSCAEYYFRSHVPRLTPSPRVPPSSRPRAVAKAPRDSSAHSPRRAVARLAGPPPPRFLPSRPDYRFDRGKRFGTCEASQSGSRLTVRRTFGQGKRRTRTPSGILLV